MAMVTPIDRRRWLTSALTALAGASTSPVWGQAPASPPPPASSLARARSVTPCRTIRRRSPVAVRAPTTSCPFRASTARVSAPKNRRPRDRFGGGRIGVGQ